MSTSAVAVRPDHSEVAGVLTPREYEAIRLRALGHTWTTICSEMHINRSTLADHLNAAKDKFNAPTLNDVWMELGWLRVP